MRPTNPYTGQPEDEDPWVERRKELESVGVFLCYAEDIDETGGWSPDDDDDDYARVSLDDWTAELLHTPLDDEWWIDADPVALQ